MILRPLLPLFFDLIHLFRDPLKRGHSHRVFFAFGAMLSRDMSDRGNSMPLLRLFLYGIYWWGWGRNNRKVLDISNKSRGAEIELLNGVIAA